MSTFSNNFNDLCNVAYNGTSADLNLGGYGSFDFDMQLFDEPAAPLFTADNGNPTTVSMQQVEKGYIPSVNSLPSLEYSPNNSDGTLSGLNSADPSPFFANMSVEEEFTPLLQPLAAFNNSAAAQGDALFFQTPKESYLPTGADLMARQESASSLPPATPRTTVLDAARPSGVRKSNKRVSKPLPEINPDLITDPTAKKRAKNTSAARKSREKKLLREQELEDLVEKLQREKEELIKQNELLRAALGSPRSL